MKTISILLALVLALSTLNENYAMKSELPPLLDRELFFGDPEISGGQLSPDGAYISFLRPLNGTRCPARNGRN